MIDLNNPDNYYESIKVTMNHDYIKQNIVDKAKHGDLALGF